LGGEGGEYFAEPFPWFVGYQHHVYLWGWLGRSGWC